MSARTDVKSQASSKTESKVNLANFKPIEAPRRKAALRDDQVSISKHSISVPLSVANKLGQQVALLFSDTDKAIAVQKSATGEFKLKQVGKSRATKAIYAKTLIEAKKIKKGRYSTSFDEKNQMLIAKVA